LKAQPSRNVDEDDEQQLLSSSRTTQRDIYLNWNNNPFENVQVNGKSCVFLHKILHFAKDKLFEIIVLTSQLSFMKMKN